MSNTTMTAIEQLADDAWNMMEQGHVLQREFEALSIQSLVAYDDWHNNGMWCETPNIALSAAFWKLVAAREAKRLEALEASNRGIEMCNEWAQLVDGNL